jgi:hypothetical protein
MKSAIVAVAVFERMSTNIFKASLAERVAIEIRGTELLSKHRSFVIFREPYLWPKVQRLGEKDRGEWFRRAPAAIGSAEVGPANGPIKASD